MSNEPKQPQQGKYLTPHEMFLQMTSQINAFKRGDIVELMEQYAAQELKPQPRECWAEKDCAPCSNKKKKSGTCGCNPIITEEGKHLPNEEGFRRAIDAYHDGIQRKKGALTAAEMLLKAHNIERLTFSLRELVLPAMERYAEQQTAALREELQGEKVLFDILINVAKELEAELEAVKKERDHWKAENAKQTVAFGFERHEHLKAKEQLSEVTRQRDEAMKLLTRIKSNFPDNAPWSRDYNTFLSHLSSGETKPVSNSCPHCASSNVIPYGTIQEWYCKNCGAQFGKSLTDKK